jgi:3-hydroxybutyryl-CoA dehydrogenase
MTVIGIAGAGAMGSGIAQVAVMAGFEVRIYDSFKASLEKSRETLNQNIQKLLQKGKITPEEAVGAAGRMYHFEDIQALHDCNLVIEAITENMDAKRALFVSLEEVVNPGCILASNTSSLSISALAACLKHPERFIGLHFFNPAYVMPLVEIIPAVQTQAITIKTAEQIILQFGKVSVLAKDSPGFIVNKVARPYYSEALRIYEEGLADFRTIDYTMKTYGFKMGPFELMDFIGHDVNYAVTRSVWEAFYYDARYKPSHVQMKLTEAGYLGRKTGRGFYNYNDDSYPSASEASLKVDEKIFNRIICMLINEAADTVYHSMCNEKDVELAVKLGVNYPKGLLAWGEELGWKFVENELDRLYAYYHDARYRVSPYIRQRV